MDCDPIVLVTADDSTDVIVTSSDQIIVSAEETVTVVVDQESDVTILETFDTDTIVLISEGQRGPQGIQGPPGPAAPYFQWHQATPASTWVIPHNIGHFVHVTVLTDDGEIWEPDVFEPSPTTATVTFPTPYSGYAYIS